jgi:hypothetical protein
MVEAILLLLFGYTICGLMLISAIILKERARKELHEALTIKRVYLLRTKGRLLLRNRKI